MMGTNCHGLQSAFVFLDLILENLGICTGRARLISVKALGPKMSCLHAWLVFDTLPFHKSFLKFYSSHSLYQSKLLMGLTSNFHSSPFCPLSFLPNTYFFPT